MPKLSVRILRSLLFALLFGLFPVLALWRYNLGQLASSALIIPLLITIAFIIVTYALGLLVSRSWEKAGLFSIITSLFMFSFGHVYNLVGEKVILGTSIGYMKLLAAYVIVYVILVFFTFRAKKVNSAIFLVGNLIGTALLLFNLVPLLVYNIKMAKPATPASSVGTTVTSSAADQSLPDIYYIVLDAYARADIMQQVIGYDNTPFIDALKQRNFYVPDCAYSNYDITLKTITSVLNMDTLENLGVTINANDEVTSGDSNLVVNDKVRSVFKQLGYKFVTGRGYFSQINIQNSDIYLDYWHSQSSNDDLDKQRFSNLYFNTTLLRVFSEIYKANPEKASWLPYWLAIGRESNAYLKEASFWYYQNNYMFDSLEKIPEMPGNYLIYAHINAPHGPYVYRSDGSFNYPLDSNDDKVLYAEEVQYLNKRVLELVDALQSKSKVQPIIILQADHSIHVLTTGLNKHKILSAYYLPGNLNTPPYATLTPVNNFRLILKDYFDPSEQLLPDTLWVKYLNDDEKVPASCDLNSK